MFGVRLVGTQKNPRFAVFCIQIVIILKVKWCFLNIFATTAPMEPYKSSDSSELRPHTVQGTNANQAKLEDSAQLAQVIVLVNELREALVGKGLINGSA